jgi:hypothetical protein
MNRNHNTKNKLLKNIALTSCLLSSFTGAFSQLQASFGTARWATQPKPDLGINALMDAVGNNDIKETRRLLDTGIDPNTPDAFRYRPLDIAPSPEMVYLLYGYRADVNKPNQFGDTPLHTAVYNCLPEVVEALLGSGADLNIKNRNNDTPISMAQLAVERGSLLNGSCTTKDIATNEERDQYKYILEIFNEFVCGLND